MSLIIDPPINPYSSAEKIRSWIERLEEMAQAHAEDAAALEVIAFSKEQAAGYLERALERENS